MNEGIYRSMTERASERTSDERVTNEWRSEEVVTYLSAADGVAADLSEGAHEHETSRRQIAAQRLQQSPHL